MGWHSALADARAAASLLDYYIAASALPAKWADHYGQVISWPGPMLGLDPVTPVVGARRGKEPRFLARLVDRLPAPGIPNRDSCLAHHGYLRTLARAAWSDDVVTGAERADLAEVAVFLGLDEHAANRMVEEETPTARSEAPSAGLRVGEFVMEPGDIVVLTGRCLCRVPSGNSGPRKPGSLSARVLPEDETARRR